MSEAEFEIWLRRIDAKCVDILLATGRPTRKEIQELRELIKSGLEKLTKGGT